MRRALVLAALGVALEAISVRRRGWGAGGRIVVCCRRGHLFTTIWLPGVSLKAARLGPWRVQRCPVGGHWSVVRPVVKGELSDAEMSSAREQRDIRLP